jgi:hypothetical protein
MEIVAFESVDIALASDLVSGPVTGLGAFPLPNSIPRL